MICNLQDIKLSTKQTHCKCSALRGHPLDGESGISEVAPEVFSSSSRVRLSLGFSENTFLISTQLMA